MAVEALERIHSTYAVDVNGVETQVVQIWFLFDTALAAPKLQSVRYFNSCPFPVTYRVIPRTGQPNTYTIPANMTAPAQVNVPNNKYGFTSDGEGGWIADFGWEVV